MASLLDNIHQKVLALTEISEIKRIDMTEAVRINMGRLEHIYTVVKRSHGFHILNSHIGELLANDWDKEALFGVYKLVTKKCLAQKLEFGDEIVHISKEEIRVKKTTGREWVFLNDVYISKESKR